MPLHVKLMARRCTAENVEMVLRQFKVKLISNSNATLNCRDT